MDIKFKIDLTTGMLVPANKSETKRVSAKLLFYVQRFDPDKLKLDLYVNNVPYCELQPMSYTSTIVAYDENPVKICLKSGSDEYCETITADMFNTIYFEAIIKKKGKVELFPNRSESTIISIRRRIEEGTLKLICIDE
jgi:hypothetical protein